MNGSYDESPERLGRVIGGTVTFGAMGSLAGIVWSKALDFSLRSGAIWGGVAAGALVLLLTLGLSKRAAGGMAGMLGGIWGGIVGVGLVVWLIRTVVG